MELHLNCDRNEADWSPFGRSSVAVMKTLLISLRITASSLARLLCDNKLVSKRNTILVECWFKYQNCARENYD